MKRSGLVRCCRPHVSLTDLISRISCWMILASLLCTSACGRAQGVSASTAADEVAAKLASMQVLRAVFETEGVDRIAALTELPLGDKLSWGLASASSVDNQALFSLRIRNGLWSIEAMFRLDEQRLRQQLEGIVSLLAHDFQRTTVADDDAEALLNDQLSENIAVRAVAIAAQLKSQPDLDKLRDLETRLKPKFSDVLAKHPDQLKSLSRAPSPKLAKSRTRIVAMFRAIRAKAL